MILNGDALEMLKTIDNESVDCVVTSPPYWRLRDYGVEGQIGNEATPQEYVDKMVMVFREIRRVLKKSGTLWLNLGDSYATGGKGGGGSFMKMRQNGAWEPQSVQKGWRSAPPGLKDKDLVGIPWRVALALQADGWYLRQDIIWHKPNPMPESVTDRCTKAHEYIFLLTKNNDYWFDHDAIKEPAVSKKPAGNKNHKYADQYEREKHETQQHRTKANLKKLAGIEWETRNRRSVWTVTTKSFKGAHFATFPPDLIEPCILAGCPEDGVVLDPFLGSGTTSVVAEKHGRKWIGVELNPSYVQIAEKRIAEARAKK
jgi:DNA modification methylase